VVTKRGPYFFADTTMNTDPTAEELADIAVLTANTVKKYNIIPRIAMLSYTNFGSGEGKVPTKVAQAVSILHKNFPGLIVDGDIQANFATNNTLLKEQFPFSTLVDKDVNTFIFPNLESGNIAYKLMQELGGAEAIGPVLMGLNKPVHVLQLGSSVREIVNMIILSVVDAQNRK
jgi:malate dehydrogenase (oxaloacetate-decarboxylating)(NADP+)